MVRFSSVQLLSRVWLFVTPWTAAPQASLSITKLPEPTQTHVHWVGDAIQPSHPLSSPSLPAFSLSQHQGLFQWVSSSHQVAKVLEFQLQHQSFQWVFSWFPLEWTAWISLEPKGLSRVFSNTTNQKHQFFSIQLSLWSNSHIHTWLLEKPQLWLNGPLSVISLLLNKLSRFVIAFLPKSKCLLISWLQSPSAVILEPKKIKSLNVSIVSPSICHEVMGPYAMIFIFWIFLSQLFHSSLSLSSRGSLFSSSLLSAIRVVSSAYLRLLIFSPVILIPACALSSLASRMMYSAYKLNKQSDNIQPWCTPFPILNQSFVLCPVLTAASWLTCSFLRRQVKWSGTPIC